MCPAFLVEDGIPIYRRLLIEIYTIYQNLSPDDYKKEFLLFSRISGSFGYLPLPPTNARSDTGRRGNNY